MDGSRDVAQDLLHLALNQWVEIDHANRPRCALLTDSPVR